MSFGVARNIVMIWAVLAAWLWLSRPTTVTPGRALLGVLLAVPLGYLVEFRSRAARLRRLLTRRRRRRDGDT